MADYQEIVLRDGSILVLPDSMPDEQVMVSVRNAEDQLTANSDLSSDPAETDAWLPYAGKHAAATTIGSGGGIASTLDFLGNTIAVGPRMAYNWYQDQPLLTGFGGSAARDAYDQAAPAVPRGSDYETNAKISSVVAPAVAETLLTGSPKTAPLRAMRDLAGGMIGGQVGETLGDLYSEEAGDLGRMFGGAVSPLAASRGGLKALNTLGVGVPLYGLSRLGLNPLDLIPKMSGPNRAGAVTGGGGVAESMAYGQDEEKARRLRFLDEQNRLMEQR